MSGEQEPWVFRGGLTADLQRLIPVDSGSDLFVYKAPDVPTSMIYTVRPYIIEDELAVYDVCRKTCVEDAHLSQIMTEHPDLAPDRFVGAFLTFSPELCFVVEDESGIVGYACAALDAKQFQTKMQVAWLPEMCSKYPTEMSNSSSLPAQEMIRWFHSFKSDGDAVSDSIKAQHPSTMTCSLLSSVFDQSVAKRLVICVLAALRANGSFGVHVPVNAQDRHLIEFYSKLGFIELTPGSNAPIDRTVLLGRAF